MTEHEAELMRIHAILSEASKLVVALYPLKIQVSSDTAFAIGESAGILSKAKALVGRDIDDIRRQQ